MPLPLSIGEGQLFENKTMKKRVVTRVVVSDVTICKRGRGEFMTVSTKTNSTALSYLSIITTETVEMIAMKIFKFVKVATQSHRQEETGGFFKVLRGDRGHLRG